MPQVLQPAGWPRPKGYANGVVAKGRQVYVAGMVGLIVSYTTLFSSTRCT